MPSDMHESMDVPLTELHLFPVQPFKVCDDAAMETLVESIRLNGLLNRIIVRPQRAGGYEIISGHRRTMAYQKLGYNAIPAEVRNDLDDDAAAIALVETNLRQRPKLLPSERAKAYRLMHDIWGQLREKDGCRRGETRNKIGALYGENPRQVTRYIRLSYLNERLLDQTDAGKLKLGSAVAISFLDERTQAWIADEYDRRQIFPDAAQIKELRRLSEAGEMTKDRFAEVMCSMPAARRKEDFVMEIQEEYFPDFTREDVKEKIRELIDKDLHRKRMGF